MPYKPRPNWGGFKHVFYSDERWGQIPKATQLS